MTALSAAAKAEELARRRARGRALNALAAERPYELHIAWFVFEQSDPRRDTTRKRALQWLGQQYPDRLRALYAQHKEAAA